MGLIERLYVYGQMNGKSMSESEYILGMKAEGFVLYQQQ